MAANGWQRARRTPSTEENILCRLNGVQYVCMVRALVAAVCVRVYLRFSLGVFMRRTRGMVCVRAADLSPFMKHVGKFQYKKDPNKERAL